MEKIFSGIGVFLLLALYMLIIYLAAEIIYTAITWQNLWSVIVVLIVASGVFVTSYMIFAGTRGPGE